MNNGMAKSSTNLGTVDDEYRAFARIKRIWRENSLTHEWVKDKANHPWPGAGRFTCKRCQLFQFSDESDGPQWSHSSCNEYVVSLVMDE